ncbi:hypothetical protein LguiB_031824 [Lonicera macranthoides]
MRSLTETGFAMSMLSARKMRWTLLNMTSPTMLTKRLSELLDSISVPFPGILAKPGLKNGSEPNGLSGNYKGSYKKNRDSRQLGFFCLQGRDHLPGPPRRYLTQPHRHTLPHIATTNNTHVATKAYATGGSIPRRIAEEFSRRSTSTKSPNLKLKTLEMVNQRRERMKMMMEMMMMMMIWWGIISIE